MPSKKDKSMKKPKSKEMHYFSVIFIFTMIILAIGLPSASVDAQDGTPFSGEVTVPDSVTFTSTGSMHEYRIFHTTTLLNNGQVLVTGGYDLITASKSSAEIYDPVSGTWSITGNMAAARRGHTATLLVDGTVLVTGGVYSSAYASSELFNPDTGLWSTTGNMNSKRYYHTATLLNDGTVLIAGGYDGSNSLTSAELYDPGTGTWSVTGSMTGARHFHTATLLSNGQVLVTGGVEGYNYDGLKTAEIYDPETGSWDSIESMSGGRLYHEATLLNNGQVLVTGIGYIYPGISTAELFDPILETWTVISNLNDFRGNHTADLLSNGKILVTGGSDPGVIYSSSELYDLATDTWITTGNLHTNRTSHSSAVLQNGKVLILGGTDSGAPSYLDSAELGTLVPGNELNATLTLPSGWQNTTNITAEILGTSTGATIDVYALSNNNIDWGSWTPITSGETTQTFWDVTSDGVDQEIFLRLKDVNGVEATVVSGTVNVDSTKPSSTMTLLPAASPLEFNLAWSGSDALSGLAGFDVQYRLGLEGDWINVLSNTAETSTIFAGTKGNTYYFRTRAIDIAGNLEDWPADFDTFTFTADYPNSNAGNDQVVNTLSLVTLDGSASCDPYDYLPLSFYWTQTAGPKVMNDSTEITPEFIAPSYPTSVTFALTVTNDLGLTDPSPDYVTIFIVTPLTNEIYLPLIFK